LCGSASKGKMTSHAVRGRCPTILGTAKVAVEVDETAETDMSSVSSSAATWTASTDAADPSEPTEKLSRRLRGRRTAGLMEKSTRSLVLRTRREAYVWDCIGELLRVSLT